MFQLDLPVDDYWEKRRRAKKMRDEERKRRIFNPDISKCAVDPVALDQQIAEKQQRATQDIIEQQQFMNYVAEQDKRALMEESRRRRMENQSNKELKDYWKEFQRKDQTREYDLNLPKRMRDDSCFYEDGDPRCGPSSCLRFAGEDAQRAERDKFALDKNRLAWDKQREHKDRLEQMNREIDKLEMERGRLLDEELEEAHQLKKDIQQAMAAATSKYNSALARAAREQRLMGKQLEQQDSINEIYNLMHSDMLNERAGGRDAYRGLSQSDKDSAQRELAQQIEENKRVKEQDKIAEALSLAEYQEMNKRAYILDKRIERLRDARMRAVANENQINGKSKRVEMNRLNEELGKNAVSEDFYNQFQKDAR